MHPAVVFVRDDVVPHVRRLRVAADDVVVEGGSRLKHGSQGAPLHERGEESLADEPAGLVAALAERILLDERAEDVGDRLGERSALALVLEPRRVLCDPVRELVADHGQRAREALEDLPVAIAEDHATAVPEGVVIAIAVVHDGVESHVVAVDGCAPEGVKEHPVRVSEAVVRLVDGGISARRVAFLPHDAARQRRGALGVVDGATRCRDAVHPGSGCQRVGRGGHFAALAAHGFIDQE